MSLKNVFFKNPVKKDLPEQFGGLFFGCGYDVEGWLKTRYAERTFFTLPYL